MTDKIVRHAYFYALEFPLGTQAGVKEHLMRFHLRGYYTGKPGIGIKNSVDGLLLINPLDIPESFQVGKKIKITLEVEE